MQEGDEAVAWVIVGEGQDWTPDKSAWTRLEVLRGGSLPEPIKKGTLRLETSWEAALKIVTLLRTGMWQ